ncbi:copper amine oxidase N-terminal domain-containing protein [Clostridiaceae bacterium 35-E11]
MNKKFQKAVSVSVITACVLASPLGIVAKAEKPEAKQNKTKIEAKAANEKMKFEKDNMNKVIFKMDKEAIAERLNTIENSEKLEEYKLLLEDLKAVEKDVQTLKHETKRIKQAMKKLMKKRYSEEALEELKEKAEAIIAENPEVVVIPVENVITKKDLKFDTPPVIKQGRTLIPVRAITEGFGAEVKWNPEERKVTIIKNDIEIIFQLDDTKVLVNGEEKDIDVSAQLMNNRTIVPLRFIVENLGLKIDYDADTETIEIDEEDTAAETDEVIIEDIDEVIVEEIDGEETDEDTVIIEEIDDEDDEDEANEEEEDVL